MCSIPVRKANNVSSSVQQRVRDRSKWQLCLAFIVCWLVVVTLSSLILLVYQIEGNHGFLTAGVSSIKELTSQAGRRAARRVLHRLPGTVPLPEAVKE